MIPEREVHSQQYAAKPIGEAGQLSDLPARPSLSELASQVSINSRADLPSQDSKSPESGAVVIHHDFPQHATGALSDHTHGQELREVNELTDPVKEQREVLPNGMQIMVVDTVRRGHTSPEHLDPAQRATWQPKEREAMENFLNAANPTGNPLMVASFHFTGGVEIESGGEEPPEELNTTEVYVCADATITHKQGERVFATVPPDSSGTSTTLDRFNSRLDSFKSWTVVSLEYDPEIAETGAQSFVDGVLGQAREDIAVVAIAEKATDELIAKEFRGLEGKRRDLEGFQSSADAEDTRERLKEQSSQIRTAEKTGPWIVGVAVGVHGDAREDPEALQALDRAASHVAAVHAEKSPYVKVVSRDADTNQLNIYTDFGQAITSINEPTVIPSSVLVDSLPIPESDVAGVEFKVKPEYNESWPFNVGANEPHFPLGTVMRNNDVDAGPARLPHGEALMHVFLGGDTGTGKSTKLKNIAFNGCYQFDVPFLVVSPINGADFYPLGAAMKQDAIDNWAQQNPAAAEALAIRFPEGIPVSEFPFDLPKYPVIRANLDDQMIGLNFLEAAPGVPVINRAAMVPSLLLSTWKGGAEGSELAYTYLDLSCNGATGAKSREGGAVKSIYEDAGINVMLNESRYKGGMPRTPTIKDLERKVDQLIAADGGYGKDTGQTVGKFLLTRLHTLQSGLPGLMMTNRFGFNPSKLHEVAGTQLDISDLPSGPQELLMAYMSIIGFEQRAHADMIAPRQTAPELKFVEIIDEIGVLVGKTPDGKTPQSAIDLIRALSVARKGETGLVLANQLLTTLPEEMIALPRTRLSGAVGMGAEQEAFAKATKMSPAQEQHMRTLETGELAASTRRTTSVSRLHGGDISGLSDDRTKIDPPSCLTDYAITPTYTQYQRVLDYLTNKDLDDVVKIKGWAQLSAMAQLMDLGDVRAPQALVTRLQNTDAYSSQSLLQLAIDESAFKAVDRRPNNVTLGMVTPRGGITNTEEATHQYVSQSMSAQIFPDLPAPEPVNVTADPYVLMKQIIDLRTYLSDPSISEEMKNSQPHPSTNDREIWKHEINASNARAQLVAAEAYAAKMEADMFGDGGVGHFYFSEDAGDIMESDLEIAMGGVAWRDPKAFEHFAQLVDYYEWDNPHAPDIIKEKFEHFLAAKQSERQLTVREGQLTAVRRQMFSCATEKAFGDTHGDSIAWDNEGYPVPSGGKGLIGQRAYLENEVLRLRASKAARTGDPQDQDRAKVMLQEALSQAINDSGEQNNGNDA